MPSRWLHHRDGTSDPAQSHFLGLEPSGKLDTMGESRLQFGQHLPVAHDDTHSAKSRHGLAEEVGPLLGANAANIEESVLRMRRPVEVDVVYRIAKHLIGVITAKIGLQDIAAILRDECIVHLRVVPHPAILPRLARHAPELLGIRALVAVAPDAARRHGLVLADALLVIVVESPVRANREVVVHGQEKAVSVPGGCGEYGTAQYLCPGMNVNDGPTQVIAAQQLAECLIGSGVPNAAANSIELRGVAVDGAHAEAHGLRAGFDNLIANGPLATEEDDLAPFGSKKYRGLDGDRYCTALDVAEVADDDYGRVLIRGHH